MDQPKFNISRFENRTGSVSWRVTGCFHGIRVRKNFPTREEAAAEKAVLEIKAIQAASGQRAAVTSLDDAQLREAEAVFHRIASKPRSLMFYLDYALTNYREPEHQKKVSEAVADYVAARKRELEEDQLSKPQFRRIDWELKRFEKHFKGRTMAEITPANITVFLELSHSTLKTFNNRRGVLSTFFKFAFHRGWTVENTILRVPHHRIRVRRGAAVTFSAQRARELMHFAETHEGGRWVPYFAICLFAGVRPGVPDGEITKLHSEHVCLDTGFIHIPATVSKIREPRRITIQPNLAAWLRAYPLDKYPLIVGNFKKRRERFKDRFSLTHDVLRHTYISMFVAKYRSIGEAAIQAGNSESIIRKHYLDLKTAAEADDFFAILPQKKAALAA